MMCGLAQFPGEELRTASIYISRRVGAVLLVAALAVACTGPAVDSEDELRAWVLDAEAAAENKDRSALMDLISTRYADGRGNDRERLGSVIRAMMLRQRTIALLTKIDRLDLLDGTAAEIAVTVGMAGMAPNSLGLSADAYRFELDLEKSGDDWLLIGARWGEVGSELR